MKHDTQLDSGTAQTQIAIHVQQGFHNLKLLLLCNPPRCPPAPLQTPFFVEMAGHAEVPSISLQERP